MARDLLEDIEAWYKKPHGRMDQDLMWAELREIVAWHQEHRHTAREYPEGCCVCQHRYCDGSCHVDCPECNPDHSGGRCPIKES